MMNEFFNQFQKEVRNLRLSREEKQRMRVKLYEAMQRSPLVAPARMLERERAVKSPYFWFNPRMAGAFAAVLIVTLGGGTAFAAQGSLPGEPLYAVKVNVNEKLAVALATTPAAKAQVNASLAQTRLEEAETLAAQGSLGSSTSDELAANFDAHAQAADDAANELESEDPGAAAQIKAQLDSSIAAHSAILAQLGNDSEDAQVQQDSNTLALHVLSHTEGEDNGRPAIALAASAKGSAPRTFATAFNVQSTTSTSSEENAPSPSTNEDHGSNNASDTSVATFLKMKANNALAQVQTDYAKQHDSLASSSISLIDAQITNIEAQLSAGDAALATSDTSSAINDYTQALKLSVKLDAFLTANQRFNKNILPRLLGNRSDGEGKGNNSHDGNHSGDNEEHATQIIQVETNATGSTQTQGGDSGSSNGGDSGGDHGGDSGHSGGDSGDSRGSLHLQLDL